MLRIINLPIVSNFGLSQLYPNFTYNSLVFDGNLINTNFTIRQVHRYNANSFSLVDDDNESLLNVTDEGIFAYGQLVFPNPNYHN